MDLTGRTPALPVMVRPWGAESPIPARSIRMARLHRPSPASWVDYRDPMLTTILAVAAAGLDVTPLLGSHAVLQQGRPIPVWGTADPGAEVTVVLGADRATARASTDGTWRVHMGPREASPEPITLVVTSGPDRHESSDLLVGETWIASGQSNMWWPVRNSADPEQVAAESNDPLLRVFTEPLRSSLTPVKGSDGAWVVVTPETTPNLTAVGLHFGRSLRAHLDVPVGIVHASWGGSSVQAWMDEATLRNHPESADSVKRLKLLRSQHAFDGPAMRGASVDTRDWSNATLPATYAALGWDVDGTAWFRRTVDIPTSWAGQDLVAHLGPIDDIDITTFGGHGIGESSNWTTPRQYTVPGQLVQAGPIDIAVEVTDRAGVGGFVGTAEQMRLVRADGTGDPIDLAGTWKWKKGPLVSAPQQTPTALYHGMLEPLLPLHPRGTIWYQGESNAHEPQNYAVLFPAMITLWRKEFNDADMPFHFVQLANLDHHRDNWHWPELRESQRNTLTLPNTGMAVCFDVGNPTDIHPKDKRTVGERLARWALANDYGRPIAPSGPLPAQVSSDGKSIMVIFDAFGGELATRDRGDITLLEIAGEDGVFHPATAVLSGSHLVAHSDDVPRPVQVRYGWREDPAACNLVGADGLPASSFWVKLGTDPRLGPVQR